MNLQRFICTSSLVLILCTSLIAQDKTGDLKITFKLKGDIPALKNIAPTTDKPFCGKNDILDERLIVNKENKGIKNVVVYVYTGRRGTELPDSAKKPRKLKLTLDNKSCVFAPHVLISQVGDTIQVNNPDEVGHNTNLPFFNNEAQNFTIPAGQSKQVVLKQAEPAVIPVACNIHPWMVGHLLVVDHPFAAISNADGELVIKGLPVGEDIVFRAWHESGTFKNEIYINDEEDKWKSNKFEFELKPGMNDMGVVEVPVDEFDL